MELNLLRVYFPEGTNGEIYHLEQLICYTIELPWKNNERQVSCIPEGRYALKKRFVEKFGWHLIVENVSDRSWILIHAANNALLQLQGCIAPETIITHHGCGNGSRPALQKLDELVFEALKTEDVYLTIKTKQL